jgi:hypothetical protein
LVLLFLPLISMIMQYKDVFDMDFMSTSNNNERSGDDDVEGDGDGGDDGRQQQEVESTSTSHLVSATLAAGKIDH